MKREERYKHYYNEGYNAGCVKGYEQAIKKACEWLYEYNRKQTDKMFGTVHTADVTINVAQFRKAMESGSSGFPNNCDERR